MVVDRCLEEVWEGVDTDDLEAPATLAYDLRLFCGEGGRTCTSPPAEWVAEQIRERLQTGDVVDCHACNGYSAFPCYVAEELRLPRVAGRGPSLADLRCGHCNHPLLESPSLR
jgi:hypothetical protein